ncbi:MAG: glucans biosynthesis glucosyltransferase MdoH [Verrucomicrobiales bacterium]|nr:glucans biosynthesis glucosyltransferase MdoH [Verrucomicrobiales bacterium]
MSSKDTVKPGSSEERNSPARTFFFFSVVLGIAGTGSYLMADYLWTLGWDFSSGVLWILFVILFSYLAFGFTHAAFGFVIRLLRSNAARMPVTGPDYEEEPELVQSRVAIVIPIYNEPVGRVFNGIAAIYDSVMRQENNEVFDFFILSDSTDPEQWIAEEAAWMDLNQQRNSHKRMFYRHRLSNVGKKSGNISDFCRTWGDHYRYMIVLDADSIMSGETLLELYWRMERNPRVGLIQTAPALVGGESVFGRMQQFSNRLYGPGFLEGLGYWSQCGGNFWGHNAIIRLRPFIKECDLPQLPGRKPFGGHILSHDFVEAGLLRRAGWEVWLAHDLDGSYEEGPQGIIESAQRDQRWCQGNLQHGLLLFARGLRGKTRIHLANGILGYLASPLWLLFMCVAFGKAFGNPHPVTEQPSLIGGIPLLIFTLCLLFGPKLMAITELAFDPVRKAQFGGLLNAVTGAIVETFFSALLAPVMMMFHSKFVLWNFVGRTVDWAAQRRGAQGTSWDEAIAAHGFHTLIGLAVGIVAGLVNPTLFWWLSPVLLGLCFSIPFSVWTSRRDIGLSLKREDLFIIPEELNAPREIEEALSGEENEKKPYQGVTSAVLDPFLNAVHVSLLRRARRRLVSGQRVYSPEESFKLPTEGESIERRLLAERLLKEGPKSLDRQDTITILSDIDSMLWMHREAWMRSSGDLSPWWEHAIRKSSVAV